LHFTGKVQDITDETKPIILRCFYSLGIRSGSGNSSTTHCSVLSVDFDLFRSETAVGIERLRLLIESQDRETSVNEFSP
jgi:hypothetical protein